MFTSLLLLATLSHALAQPQPEAHGHNGLSPLIHAAAYGSFQDIQRLLAAGADPNTATPEGFTPLMFATGDTAKLNLLLKAGAQPNAAAKSGATPLLMAALRGNLDAVRILLDSGVDFKARMAIIPNAPIRLDLLQIAYTINDPALRQLLAARGLKPDLKSLTGPPGSVPMSGLFINTGFSMRPTTISGVARGVADILALGADPNADVRQLTRALPPISLAAQFSDTEAVRHLLQRGANPNRPGTQGVTPLMMAASAEDPNSETLSALLDAGADLHTRDALGRTALDWALMQGESPVTKLLRARGAVSGEGKPSVPPVAVKPIEPRILVETGLTTLLTSAEKFHQQTRCISCHHHSIAAVAAAVARKRGVPLPQRLAAHPTAATLEMWAPARENLLAGNCGVFGFLGNVSYGLFGLAEENVPPNAITDAAALCLSSLQLPDGRWEGGDMRPPLAGRAPFVYTALAARAIQTYLPSTMRKQAQTQIAKARAYLTSATPADTQGESFRLLGLVWTRASSSEIARQSARLRSLQSPTGGWSQRPSMPPDAYATGQALYAMHVAGVSAKDAPFRKGAAFLLRTQTAQGTWFVPSRTLGFQPYLETGFPYGRDQFLSAAATAWALAALALTI